MARGELLERPGTLQVREKWGWSAWRARSSVPSGRGSGPPGALSTNLGFLEFWN